MFVHDEGAGTPVLMLHAGASAGAQWTGYARALGVRTLAPDLHGHGRTPIPPGLTADHAIDTFVADLLALLGPSDRFHLVGHSFGGLVAIALALRAPDRVLSLTAIEPACFDALRLCDPLLHAQSCHEVAQLNSLVATDRPAQAMQQVLARWGMAHWDLLTDTQRATLTAMAPALLTIGLSAALRWHFDPTRLAALAHIPTLLIHGEHSPDVAAPICQTIAAAIPGSRCTLLEGAGHMLPLTHRSALKALLRPQFDLTPTTTGPR